MLQQISLFEQEKTDSSLKNSTDWLINYLGLKGLKINDKHYKGGSLWVVGGNELKSMFTELANKDIHFRFAPFVSHSTNMQPGWYTKYGS